MLELIKQENQKYQKKILNASAKIDATNQAYENLTKGIDVHKDYRSNGKFKNCFTVFLEK